MVKMLNESRLAIPQPYTGLMAAFKPIDTKMLNMVEENAYNVSVSNTDIVKIVDTIMGTIEGFAPPEAFQQIQGGIEMAQRQLGVNFRDGLLASIAGPSVMYMIPPGTMQESPNGGGIFICKLTNGKLFKDNLVALENFAQAQLRKAEMNMFMVSEQPFKKYQIRSWIIGPATMFGFSPSWTIYNNHLVFGSNDAMCRSAVSFLDQPISKRKSIVNNPRFKAATADMPKNLITFSYTDTEKEFIAMSTGIRQVWGMVSGMVAMGTGINVPQLPNLTHHAKDMLPAVSYCWSEKDGIYTYQRGSNSTSSLGVGGVAAGALGVSILMPALSKARERARTVQCGSNLRMIGLGIALYSQDHRDQYPVNVEDLVREADLDPKVFLCPSTDNKIDMGGVDFDEFKIKNEDTSFHFHLKDVDCSKSASIVLAFDKFENHNGEVRNVLFNDMHVQRYPEAEFIKLIERNNKIRKSAGLPLITITDGPYAKKRTTSENSF